MELKKNPSKDIHEKSGIFFFIGLGVSLSLIIVAFEWTSLKPITRARNNSIGDYLTATIDPIVSITEPRATESITEKLKKATIPETITETKDENLSEDSFEPVISMPDTQELEDIIDPENSDNDLPMVFAETMPKPEGDYDNLYKFLSNEIKYPSRARRENIQGRVFVEFVINKTGQPQDIKVVKGIGYGCDEEAVRVISLTKWEPGKQRGKSVKVKMILPLVFKLQ